MRKSLIAEAVVLAYLVSSGCLQTGCNLFDEHIKQMDTLRAMATDAQARLKDGSVGQMSVAGQAINPGVEVEAAIKYAASARYAGLAGQFQASAHGELGALTPAEAERYYKIVNDASLTDAARAQMLKDFIAGLLSKSTTQPVQ